MQMDRILSCVDESETADVISSTPAHVYESWYESLVHICGREAYVPISAGQLLEILSFSARALSAAELYFIYKSYSTPGLPLNLDDPSVNLDFLEDVCSDFVAIIPPKGGAKNCTLRLVHPRMKTFLVRNSSEFTRHLPENPLAGFSILESQANLKFGKICLFCLLQFTEQIGLDVQKDLAIRSLLDYSAHYWYIHALHADDAALNDLMLVLFTSEEYFTTWLSVYDPDDQKSSKGKTNHPSPLYYACLIGFYDLTERLLDQGARLGEAGGRHNYPLLAAVEAGHQEIVRLLLERGDEANRRFENGDSAVIRAAAHGNAETVQSLLMHGADLNARDKDHLTALHRAVRQRHHDVISLLLESGADC